METELARIFSKANLRLTTPRIAIFTALKESDNPLTTTEIIAACPDIDKVSVYRTIKLFTTLNVVTPITRGWKQLYELSAPFHPHHHHMTCTVCGSVVDIKSPQIETLVQKISEQYSFIPSSHHFEMQGICQSCSHLSKLATQ